MTLRIVPSPYRSPSRKDHWFETDDAVSQHSNKDLFLSRGMRYANIPCVWHFREYHITLKLAVSWFVCVRHLLL